MRRNHRILLAHRPIIASSLAALLIVSLRVGVALAFSCWTNLNCCPCGYYQATAYTQALSGEPAGELNMEKHGGNNSMGWHFTSVINTECRAPSTCQLGPDAVHAIDHNPPSTARYAATLHEAWQGGLQQWGAYSSTDRAHSCYNAWATARATC